MKFKHLVTSFLALIVSSTVFAQETEIVAEETASKTQSTEKKEITVVGTNESLESKSEVLSRDIDRSQAVDPADAATKIPGVHVIKKGGIGYNLVLRDAKKDSYASTVDGSELWGACPNRMDPPTFHTDFSQLKSMKVIKGPFNVTQPNAAAGSVDLETWQPGEQKNYLEAEASYGSYNEFMSSLSGNFSAGAFSILGGATHRSSNVYLTASGDPVTSQNALAGTYSEKYENKDARMYNVNTYWGKLGYAPAENQLITVGGSYQNATDTLYPYLKMDAPVDTYTSASAAYQISDLGKIESIKFNAFYNAVDHLMNNKLRDSFTETTATTPMFMETEATTQTYGADLTADYKAGDAKIKAGLDFYNRFWNAENTIIPKDPAMKTQSNMIPEVATLNMGIFANVENPLSDSLLYTAGARFDYATSTTGEDNSTLRNAVHGDAKDKATLMGYAANVQLNYLPMESLTVFNGLGTASRLPDPSELFIVVDKPPYGLPAMSGQGRDWVGNSSLNPEQRYEDDLGMQWKNNTLKAKTTFFYAYIVDYIAIGKDPTGRATTYYNTNAQSYGNESELEYQFVKNFFLTGTLAFTRAQKETTDKLHDADMGEISPLTGTLGIRWEMDGIYAALYNEFADKQNFVDTDIKETTTAAWNTLNAGLGIEKETFGVHFAANNLLNRGYTEHLQYNRDPFTADAKVPQPGTNFQLSASYRLQ